MSVVASDTLPEKLLGRFRGPVTDGRPTYPERVHVEVRDAQGGLWCLATWDADYSPENPEVLNGKDVVSANLDGASGVLTVGFSDDSVFTVTPNLIEEDEDIENWELFTPEGLVLTYGPRGRWHLGSADDPC
jgi:hypothetical protein